MWIYIKSLRGLFLWPMVAKLEREWLLFTRDDLIGSLGFTWHKNKLWKISTGRYSGHWRWTWKHETCAVKSLKCFLFQGKKFAMYLIVPHDIDGLQTLSQKITPEGLAKSLKLMKKHNINLSLPKFQFESTSVLVPVLKEVYKYVDEGDEYWIFSLRTFSDEILRWAFLFTLGLENFSQTKLIATQMKIARNLVLCD